jgi:hypothetical protein
MDPVVRSFSRADRAAMRAVYVRCLAEMGLVAGSTLQHRSIARAILKRYAAGSTDPDRLARVVVSHARHAGVRRLWARFMAMLTGRPPVN